jgi:2-aminoadipate transaminase
MTWTFAGRTHQVAPSVIRDLSRIVTQSNRIISLAAGMPSPKTFPVEAFAQACRTVLGRDDAASSLQYASTEGLPELREAVAKILPWAVDPETVLITSGSQQGLDLVGRAFIDTGSRILVERPTYPGALQAFASVEPEVSDVESDEEGIDVDHLVAQAAKGTKPRFVYVLPSFQNPTGRTMSEPRRNALAKTAIRLGLPIVEDNPYGDLWYDTPPPPPLAARCPENAVYLGTFSKTLAPGLRLGFAVAPKDVLRQLALAKQAADLQPATFAQRLVVEVLKDGFLERHIASIRTQYKAQRDAMLSALSREFGGDGSGANAGLRWNVPGGGMFIWVRLPGNLSATALLPLALEKGVAFVPGSAFYLRNGDDSSLRLSFVTATPAEIDVGIGALSEAVRQASGAQLGR